MSDFKLQEHLVLFIDFLGSSDVAKNWNEEKIQTFLELLSELSSSQAAFDINGGSQADGSYKINITPEFTTFSDHIVASYPTYMLEVYRDEPSIPQDYALGIILNITQKIVGGIAIKALDAGLLIRGGFTMGQLYHSAGVVFG